MLGGLSLGGQILQTVVLELFSSLLSFTFFSFSYVPSNPPEVGGVCVGGWGSDLKVLANSADCSGFSTKVYLEDRVSL